MTGTSPGAGAPMDSPSLTATAKALAGSGFRVARFEFDYMAGRRTEAGRKPPPRAEKLNPEYIAALDALDARRPLIIGGKSMGGRVASMVADDLFASGRVGGLLCLGYPFHPPARPEHLRTKHLVNLKTPTLIVQGTRDEFGTREDVSAYTLSPAIEYLWLEDGNHDLKPRKSISGFSSADHLKTMAEAVSTWAERIAS
jgi:predicted alpha/beta-hydrolase family hydrolase